MKMNGRILLILLTLIYGCIDPIELDISEELRILVVEGFISTGPGPHQIKLSKGAKFGDILNALIKSEVGADVWIRDNDGNVTFLTEVSPGTYLTPDHGNITFIDEVRSEGTYFTPDDWRAELHKSYTLNIITGAGAQYTSSPETIVPVAPIDSLILQFKKIPTADPAIFISGVEVFARFQDPPDSRDFYIWRNNGTYIIETHPELFTIRNIFNPGMPIPAPKDCCSICWIFEFNADFSIKILNDKNSNGTINTELAAFIPDDGLRFHSKYMAVIRQLSISSEAHAFFDLLEKQLSIDGDIFDPPPATIRGNMINLDNPEENVIGYFHASDVSIDTIFIERSVLEDFQNARQINDDCRVLRLATVDKPDFWE